MLPSCAGLTAPGPRAPSGRLSMQLRLPQSSRASTASRPPDKRGTFAAAHHRRYTVPRAGRYSTTRPTPGLGSLATSSIGHHRYHGRRDVVHPPQAGTQTDGGLPSRGSVKVVSEKGQLWLSKRSVRKICVLGADVVGLSSAVRLAEELQFVKVPASHSNSVPVAGNTC